MDKSFDLSRLERSTWATTYQNGLVDIMIGTIFLLSTIAALFDHLRYILYPMFLLPALLFAVVWRWLVIPRLGLITFSRARRRKNRSLYLALTIPLVILVGLRLFHLPDVIPGGAFPLIFLCAVILIIFSSIAYFMDFTRMYLYGFLTTALFLLREALRPHPELVLWKNLAFLPAALVMISTGTVLLARFIKAYPLPGPEAADEG